MIQLYTGTPGSGKSLHLAKDIYHYARTKKRHLIICNFAVDTSKLKHPERVLYIDNSDLKTPDVIIQIAKNYNFAFGLAENNIILMIDECQLLFNARSWNEDGRREWLSFFTQHRKLGFLVTLISQFDGMIDKQIRALIEYQTVHRKVSNFGTFGLLSKLLLFGQDLFVWVESWYHMKEKTSSGFYLARKRYYSLYDTFNTFASQNG